VKDITQDNLQGDNAYEGENGDAADQFAKKFQNVRYGSQSLYHVKTPQYSAQKVAAALEKTAATSLRFATQ